MMISVGNLSFVPQGSESCCCSQNMTSMVFSNNFQLEMLASIIDTLPNLTRTQIIVDQFSVVHAPDILSMEFDGQSPVHWGLALGNACTTSAQGISITADSTRKGCRRYRFTTGESAYALMRQFFVNCQCSKRNTLNPMIFKNPLPRICSKPYPFTLASD